MALWLEPCGKGDLGDETRQLLLGVVVKRNVIDGTAAGADEVMVMAANPLCQLIAGGAAQTMVRHDDATALENGQRPIQRGQRDMVGN